MFHKLSCVLAATAILMLGSAIAQAQTVWHVNPALSSATIQFTDTVIPANQSPTNSQLTLHLGNQTPPNVSSSGTWSVGSTGALSGDLQTNYVDGTSIQFAGGTLAGVNGLTNGPFIVAPTGGGFVPNPAVFNAGGPGTGFGGPSSPNIVSTAPAMWGGSLSVTEINGGTPQAYFDFLNANFALTSAVLPISGGVFAASSTALNLTSIDNALVTGSPLISDYYVQNVNPAANPNNHSLGGDGLPAPSWGGANGVPVATITTVGNVETLTYQFAILPNPNIGYFPVVFYSGSVPFIGAMTGTIVATATIPEPSSVVLGSLGLVAALGVCIRRRYARG